MKYQLSLLLLLFAFISCKDPEEKFRPSYHFTPKQNWVNDPNGLFYYEGKYHLYFQHNPNDNVWGPMHWGHATSYDLINWKEENIALYPDENGYIFSGSIVVDSKNSSGLGVDNKVPIIALYTNHNPKGESNDSIQSETQYLAYSLDSGYTWTKYKNNPIINNPGIKDFRDPKVVWDEDSNKWIMALAVQQEVFFYGSQNLLDWNLLSKFGKNYGSHSGVWECPELMKLPVNDQESKWVLIVSINPGGPNGGSATQYFVGDFDGTNFNIDDHFAHEIESNHSYWLDFGKDNYASVSFDNARKIDGSKIMIGWMSNWLYAQKVPTKKWRNGMTIPREVKLKKHGDSYRLISNPVRDLNLVRAKKISGDNLNVNIDKTKIVDSNTISLNSSEINISLKISEGEKYTFTLENQLGETLSFGYDDELKEFFVDRTDSGIINFSEMFANRASVAPRTSIEKTLKIKALIDTASIELFYDGGETVMTELFFSNEPFNSFNVNTKYRDANLDTVDIHVIKSN